MACDEYHHHCTQDLRRPHARLPDERARLRAACRPARDGRLRRRQQPARDGPPGGGRRRRLQHLRGAGERRQQALRQPRPAAAGQDPQPRHADRGRRLHGAEGPLHHRAAGAVGRRRVRHQQHRQPARPARPGPPQQARRGRDPREPRGVPQHAADPARLGLRRLGVDLGGLQQHLHVLHRARACAARRPTVAPATSSPRSRRWSSRASSRSPCSGRTSTPTASSSATGSRSASCCAPAATIDGLERVRFTSPHPAAFTDDVIAAMAETPNVMPSLHMPLQSGSDRVLKAMRRSYRSDKFLGIIDRVREQIPDAAITTDIIVGFPGETEADFEETLRVVRESRFASAFTFQYSIRAGTPAATMPDQLPKAVVQERYERLLGRPGGDLLGREPHRRGPRRRGAGRHRRGPQGHRDPPPLRPGARQPAGPLRRARRRRAPPPRRPGHGRGHLRRPAPPGGRRGPRRAAPTPCGAPPAATPGRRCRTPRSRASRESPWVCRVWADPRPSPPRPAAELPAPEIAPVRMGLEDLAHDRPPHRHHR